MSTRYDHKIDASQRGNQAANAADQPPCRVNDSLIRFSEVQGDVQWHKHDLEDKFFFVVEGKLFIDLENAATVELLPNQGFTVPKGVVHRTRAPERTAMLMIESAATTPPPY